jgi:hypothetical protein
MIIPQQYLKKLSSSSKILLEKSNIALSAFGQSGKKIICTDKALD